MKSLSNTEGGELGFIRVRGASVVRDGESLKHLKGSGRALAQSRRRRLRPLDVDLHILHDCMSRSISLIVAKISSSLLSTGVSAWLSA